MRERGLSTILFRDHHQVRDALEVTGVVGDEGHSEAKRRSRMPGIARRNPKGTLAGFGNRVSVDSAEPLVWILDDEGLQETAPIPRAASRPSRARWARCTARPASARREP